MAMYALTSAGGSPGVTTSALALALTWPAPVALAECDPAGGNILAGLFAGHLTAPRGLLGVAFEVGRGQAAVAAEIESQLARLDRSGAAAFLAGLSDPRQAPGLAPAWPVIARALADRSGDVIADCGRLDAGDCQPVSVLAGSVAVVLVLRASLRQVAAARPRIEMIGQLLGSTTRLGLLLVSDGRNGGRGSREIAGALGVPVIASLPFDPRTASVLSDGGSKRGRLAGGPLLRAAKAAGLAIGQFGQRAGLPGRTGPAGWPVVQAGKLP